MKRLKFSFLIFLLVYFSYHLIDGQHGLLTWYDLNQRLSEALKERKESRVEENFLKRRIVCLFSDSPSKDLLTEYTKEILGYSRIEEVVIQLN